jgi:hypothetical protein
MLETPSTPEVVQPPTIVDPAGNPAPATEPTLASRRAELVDLVTQRAQKVATTTRTRLETARNTATARVQDLRKAGAAFVTTSRNRIRESRAAVPARVRSAVHDQLERAASALQAAAKRVAPRA